MTNNSVHLLPVVASVPGQRKLIQKAGNDPYSLTVIPAVGSGDTIDGDSSLSLLTQWDSVELVADGISNWIVVGSSAKTYGVIGLYEVPLV